MLFPPLFPILMSLAPPCLSPPSSQPPFRVGFDCWKGLAAAGNSPELGGESIGGWPADRMSWVRSAVYCPQHPLLLLLSMTSASPTPRSFSSAAPRSGEESARFCLSQPSGLFGWRSVSRSIPADPTPVPLSVGSLSRRTWVQTQSAGGARGPWLE